MSHGSTESRPTGLDESRLDGVSPYRVGIGARRFHRRDAGGCDRDGLAPKQIARSAAEHEGAAAAFWYGLSLAAFVLALLSKTSTVMLPLLLLGGAAFRRGRIAGAGLDLHRTVLWPGAGVWADVGVVSKAPGAGRADAGAGEFWERLAIAGRAFWFYLGKALAPVRPELGLSAVESGRIEAGVVPAGAAGRSGSPGLLALPPQLGAGRLGGAGSFCGDIVSGAGLL